MVGRPRRRFWPREEGFCRRLAARPRFEPAMDEAVRRRKLAGWEHAVRRTLTQP